MSTLHSILASNLKMWVLLCEVLVAAAIAVKLVPEDAKKHFIAFVTPFLYDCNLNCPTSEAVADELLADPKLLSQLEGKVAIVTGCTLGGIGAQTAGILAGKSRMEVVCAGRTLRKLEDCAANIKATYPEAKVTCLVLDVSKFDSVRAFVAAFEAQYPSAPLALLVNNAGIMAAPYATSADGYELQMATNHLGPFLLSCLLAPRLKAAAKSCPVTGSRVVNVASMAHAIPKPYGAQPLPLNMKYRDKNGPQFAAYGRSKRANVLSAMALSKRFANSGAVALSLCPGNVRTNLGQNNAASWVVYEVLWFLHKTCSQGAATTVHACLNPALKKHSGAYVIHDKVRTTAGCSDDVAEVLWRESCKAVGLTESEEAAVAADA